jgi:hypothetical protein
VRAIKLIAVALLAGLGSTSYAESVVGNEQVIIFPLGTQAAEATFKSAFPEAKRDHSGLYSFFRDDGIQVRAGFDEKARAMRLATLKTRLDSFGPLEHPSWFAWAQEALVLEDLSSAETSRDESKGGVGGLKCTYWQMAMSGSEIPSGGSSFVYGTSSLDYVGPAPFPPGPPVSYNNFSVWVQTLAFSKTPSGIVDVINSGSDSAAGGFPSVSAVASSGCGSLGCNDDYWSARWIVEASWGIGGCGSGFIEFIRSNYM